MDDALDDPERKLAAILAADVVGYSRLMGADEAGALAGLARARRLVIDPVVARHRGRIFKVMGDGLLTEFPSSLLAVRAAIAIQTLLPEHNAEVQASQRIVLRIGIHQGDVLVFGDDLLGSGVNIAARLERLAPDGGICISARVREDARGRVDVPFQDGGERLLKNIERPIRIFYAYPGTAAPPAARQPPAPGSPTPGPPAPGPPAPEPLTPRLPQPRRGGLEAGDGHGDATLYVPASTRRHSLLVVQSASSQLAPGLVVALAGNPLTIGRTPPSGLVLPGGQVSRIHCRVDVADGVATVTDLQSTNGTFVDDIRVDGPRRLASGAILRVGPYLMRYVLDEVDEAANATLVYRT